MYILTQKLFHHVPCNPLITKIYSFDMFVFEIGLKTFFLIFENALRNDSRLSRVTPLVCRSIGEKEAGAVRD